jgi:hypothetical protein
MVSSLWVSYIVDFQCFMVYVFAMLYLHMCVQHVVLVGFMEIVVISLTLWMLWYWCVSEVVDYRCVMKVYKSALSIEPPLK